MEGNRSDTIFAFDEFEVDPTRRLLLKDDITVPLKPKAFDLLLVLIESAGEVLSKKELFDLIWSEQFVEENNLTVHIAALRKALGEKKSDHRFIVTVPGHGYKFVADVQTRTKENGFDRQYPAENNTEPLKSADRFAGAPAIWRDRIGKRYFRNLTIVTVIVAAVIVAGIYLGSTYGDRASSDSIAVLPFVNASGDPNVDYLSDGITENLINDLSQFPDLKVIARSSVFRYRTNGNRFLDSDLAQVAKELGVQTILTGRLERHDNDLQISVDLVDVRSNTQLWGEHYNRKLSDVFAVQEEIARNISQKLHIKLGAKDKRDVAKRYTENLPAFEDYMMGRSYIHRRTRDDLLTAKG